MKIDETADFESDGVQVVNTEKATEISKKTQLELQPHPKLKKKVADDGEEEGVNLEEQQKKKRFLIGGVIFFVLILIVMIIALGSTKKAVVIVEATHSAPVPIEVKWPQILDGTGAALAKAKFEVGKQLTNDFFVNGDITFLQVEGTDKV